MGKKRDTGYKDIAPVKCDGWIFARNAYKGVLFCEKIKMHTQENTTKKCIYKETTSK